MFWFSGTIDDMLISCLSSQISDLNLKLFLEHLRIETELPYAMFLMVAGHGKTGLNIRRI